MCTIEEAKGLTIDKERDSANEDRIAQEKVSKGSLIVSLPGRNKP